MGNRKHHRLANRHGDLRRFPSVREAEQAVQDWKRQRYYIPSYWLTGLAQIVVTAAIAMLLPVISREWGLLRGGGWMGVKTIAFLGLVGGAANWAVEKWIWRHRFRRFLRERLNTLGIAVCIQCGYDLRGQEQTRCPECGTQVEH